MKRLYDEVCRHGNRKPNPLVLDLLPDEDKPPGDLAFHAAGNNRHTFEKSLRILPPDISCITELFLGFPKWSAVITALDFSYNFIGDAGAEELARLLPECPLLASLALIDNSIGASGMCALVEAIKRAGLAHLRAFDVSLNPLHKKGGLAAAALIEKTAHKGDDGANGGRSKVMLQELRLASCELEVDSVVAIAERLALANRTLRVLDVSNPRLFSLQADLSEHYARMVRMNPTLETVHVAKQRLGDEGTRILVQGLLENRTLRCLDLKANNISITGASHLATLLRADSNLETLILRANPIQDEGVGHISHALWYNRSLRHLDCGMCALTGKGVCQVADAIERNTTIERLELFENAWDEDSAQRFHEVLEGVQNRLTPLALDFLPYCVPVKPHDINMQYFVAARSLD